MSLGPDSLVLFPTPFSAYTSGVDFSSALEDLLGPVSPCLPTQFHHSCTYIIPLLPSSP